MTNHTWYTLSGLDAQNTNGKNQRDQKLARPINLHGPDDGQRKNENDQI